jgi:CubicO group peptidase (beta-lactamase class C family)/predicted TIM-barrel fold metal-dependent hydrolase
MAKFLFAFHIFAWINIWNSPLICEVIKRPPIIDVHQHSNPMRFLPDGRPPPILCPNDEEPCSNPPSKYQTDEAILKGTLEYMQKYNIVRSVVTGSPDQPLDHWLAYAPDRFVGGHACSQIEHMLPLDELRKIYLSGKYGILGELGMQYAGMAPDDPLLEPYFALAEELDVPVLIHTAGIGARTPQFRSAPGNPLLLEEVLKRHPKIRIYVENAGYPFGDNMIALLYQYPQVYADLSTISWIIPRTTFHDYLKRLIRAGFGKRLMFGSDQMIWPETIGMAVEAIESAAFLSQQQKRDIFFNNAVRFFKWDEEELIGMGWLDSPEPKANTKETHILINGNPVDVGMSAEMLSNAVAVFKRAVDDGDIAGAVLLVARRSQIVLHEAVGWRDMGRRIPMTLDTLFDIASITKSVVAAGTLVLAEKHKLELTAPVSDYIPEFTNGESSGIKVEHLLNHTSGYSFKKFGVPLTPEKLEDFESLRSEVAQYPKTGLTTTPGERYCYSNRGYCILSALIEIASANRLDELLNESIFAPLSMEDTFFPSRDFSSDRLAARYAVIDGRLTEARHVWPPFPTGYGYLISTASDLAKFCQMMLNGGSYGSAKILSSESVRSATRATIKTPYLYRSPEEHRALGKDSSIPRWYYMRDARALGIVGGYGYGWAVSEGGTYEHAGASGTFIWLVPEDELFAVILTQCDNARIPGNEFLDIVKASVKE